MLKNILFLALLFLFPREHCRAQNAYDEDEDLNYKSEITYGLNLNTNAGLLGGLSFRYARALSPGRFQSYSLDIVSIKHPKELRAQSLSGQSYTPGKQNYLFMLRPMYGREKVLFRKAAEQGVQINFIGAAGPTVGLLVPYIIQYDITSNIGSNPGTHTYVIEQYNPEKHNSFDRVYRSMGLGEGLSKTRFSPGLSLKAALAFEFGSYKNNVTGFEAGMVVDAMLTRPVIMPLAHNRQVLTTAYIVLFYGSRN